MDGLQIGELVVLDVHGDGEEESRVPSVYEFVAIVFDKVCVFFCPGPLPIGEPPIRCGSFLPRALSTNPWTSLSAVGCTISTIGFSPVGFEAKRTESWQERSGKPIVDL